MMKNTDLKVKTLLLWAFGSVLFLSNWHAFGYDSRKAQHTSSLSKTKDSVSVNDASAKVSQTSPESDSSFSVKVSPSSGILKQQTTFIVHLDNYKEQVKYLKIHDLIGKKIFFQPIVYKNGSVSYKINMAHLRPGIYFCSVYSEKGIVETRKIIHL